MAATEPATASPQAGWTVPFFFGLARPRRSLFRYGIAGSGRGEVWDGQIRCQVTSLNQEIVRAMAREGIPSVEMSPFACGWSTRQRNLASGNASQIIQSLHAGFVPVLHGDVVLHELLDCTILSGDVIIRHLAQLLSPKYVLFLTDVHGVYDRPPSDPNAVLLREIEVDDSGSWSIVKPALQGNKKGVETSVAAHDSTGGIETKILEAATIARLGVDVYVTKVGIEHSLREP